ncbi:BTAD domain-containing putative transcriptional regulator [Actinoplanes sp. NPDC049681]|uniref:BTAD domain-containing putative transcriptional regulator n=1 Tax=Actinoplanes sp. NPDC049681 TaxID=3363905 RepID=UPI00378D6387
MELRVLGGVEAYCDGRPVDLGPLRQRSVLAVLMAEAGRPIATDDLIERVWADSAPQRARGALHNYLSGLRQALGPDIRIDRQPHGYRLSVDPLTVDVHRFRHLVARARAGDAPDDLTDLDEALSLWRGRPFGSLDTPWFNEVREAWERERHAAELDRNDRALARGQHAHLLEDLVVAASAHPLDERLTGQLMQAMYRSGRQADALRHYDKCRRQLADELGVDPSPALQALHLKMLTNGAQVAHPDPVPIPAVTTPVVMTPEPPARRSWPAAVAVALALTATTIAVIAWSQRLHHPAQVPASTASPPTGMSPLSGEIPDNTIVAIVNQRSATSTTAAYVVDVENWSTDEGGRTHLWHWREDGDFRNQLWRVRQLPGGTHWFVNMLSGKCLAGVPTAREVVQSACSKTDATQHWKIHADGLLSNGDGTTCLKVRDDLLLEDTGLQMADCQQTWSGQWYLVRRP